MSPQGSTRFPELHQRHNLPGLCPRTPEVYRLFLRGSATGIGFRMAKGNEKERYRMASPPRKPAGARVAPQRCPILRLLTAIVYYLLLLFSTVQNSIVLDMGSTLVHPHRVHLHPVLVHFGDYDGVSLLCRQENRKDRGFCFFPDSFVGWPQHICFGEPLASHRNVPKETFVNMWGESVYQALFSPIWLPCEATASSGAS